jgi:hypothetical protein
LIRTLSRFAIALLVATSSVFAQNPGVQNYGVAVLVGPANPITPGQDFTWVLDRPENNASFDLASLDTLTIALGTVVDDGTGTDFAIHGSGFVEVSASSDGVNFTGITFTSLPAAVDLGGLATGVTHVRIVGDPIGPSGPIASVDAILCSNYNPGPLAGRDRVFADTLEAYNQGTSVSATFTAGADALGAPDSIGWDENTDWNGVVSLGAGAELDVSFSEASATNGPGADIIVYEHLGDEAEFTVSASQDGVNWFLMAPMGDQLQLFGTGSMAATSALGFDLDGTGLDSARYFRLTSTSIVDTGTSPGPDIDGIEIINLSAEYQVNQLSASLDIDGATSVPWAIMSAQNSSGVINISGLQGMPYEFGITSPEGAVTPISGAQVVSDGQIINLDQAAPSFYLNNGGNWNVPFPGNGSIAYSTLGVPNAVTAQFGVADPAAMVGYSFSAPILLDPATAGTTISLTLGNDDAVEVAAISSAYPILTFCGTGYRSFFVNSNGSVSFGAADATTSTPTLNDFQTGPSRLAGLWTDLDPSTAGTVTVSSVGAVITVAFTGVTDFTTGLTASSVSMVFDLSTGSAAISGYAPDITLAQDTLVGLSLGAAGVATDPGAQVFSTQVGLGSQGTASATDMIYEIITGGAPASFSSITFPNSDPGSWIVN